MTLKKPFTKGIAVAVAAALTIGGSGIYPVTIKAANEQDSSSAASDDTSMGRYLEEEISLPKDCSSVENIKILTDGTLRICYYDTNGKLLYSDSMDNGESWKKGTSLAGLFGIDTEKYYVCYPQFSKNREIFICARSISEEEVHSAEDISMKYYYADASGKVKDLKLEETLNGMFGFQSSFTDKGTLLLSILSNGAIEINPEDGSIVNEYEKGAMLSYFCAVQDYLMTVSPDGIHYYNLETGDPMDNQQALTQQISSNEANLQLMGVGQVPVLAIPGDQKNSLFFVDSQGIYRYVLGGSVVEQVVNGALNSISSPNINFVAFDQDQEGRFYLATRDYSQGTANTGKLLRYTFSEDTPTVPDTELTVYSLKENSLLKQAAADFQKMYPDIYLNIETGMTGEDAITDTDAIKALNTEIMAGKGPDVLILDGLPEDTYTENGMLEDLSGILKKIQDSDGILSNIQDAYTEEDGSIYRMPLRFGIPIIQGNTADIDSIKDLTSLADAVESHQSEYSASNLPTSLAMLPELLLKGLADTSSPAWIKEDGTLDEKTVSEYLEQINRIYHSCSEIVKQYVNENMISEYEYHRNEYGIGSSVIGLLSKDSLFGIGGLYSSDDLAMIDSAETKEPDLKNKLLNGQSENVFIPSSVIGISAKASEKEAAQKFVEFLFSSESQSILGSWGLPVNQSVYESDDYWNVGDNNGVVSTMSSSDGDGNYIELEIRTPSNETIQKIQELGKTLSVPATTNEIILQAVTDAGVRYLNGEIGLDEAVRAAVSEVNLYLSE